jgi:hypothetical protein
MDGGGNEDLLERSCFCVYVREAARIPKEKRNAFFSATFGSYWIRLDLDASELAPGLQIVAVVGRKRD